MFELLYAPSAVRDFKSLTPDLQDEVVDILEDLKVKSKHKELKVHKLKGKLKDFYSCSINYSHRIIFSIKGKTLNILAIGNHDIYK